MGPAMLRKHLLPSRKWDTRLWRSCQPGQLPRGALHLAPALPAARRGREGDWRRQLGNQLGSVTTAGRWITRDQWDPPGATERKSSPECWATAARRRTICCLKAPSGTTTGLIAKTEIRLLL